MSERTDFPTTSYNDSSTVNDDIAKQALDKSGTGEIGVQNESGRLRK
jgi:hypothetical protein